ncbi:MAG TPA: VWA domain-containing protein [Bryobacteraceae bacterium]|nr:VWA domain-containing protein [Bryobacteraceae bacterium]
MRSIIALCLTLLCPSALLAQTPVFRSTTHLQSIAVQVVDKKGNFVPGLAVNDFTLLEDGRPQKIAFFGAERQPVSLAILLDSSRSMDFGRKFDRARELLAPLFAGHDPKDQIFFMQFTDRIEAFRQLTPDQRLHPELIESSRGGGAERGTAVYDALASALCRMRTAENLRQAVVIITDGADQHSRLNLEQLIELAQMSTPQIFMIGFFSRPESRLFRERSKTITLLGEREIDNPVLVFDRLAKESGAEPFFPSSEQDLKKALDRIEALLQAQYTLAYYPQTADRFRKIEVRVHRGGAKVMARRGVGASSESGPVRFEASTSEVSPKDHPYPWEPNSVRTISGDLMYHEDFSDPKSGWPNRREQIPRNSGEYRPGLQYVSGGYEISRHPPANLVSSGPNAEGAVVTYGPSWDNVRASISVQSTFGPFPHVDQGAGLVFHLNEAGYYAAVLTGGLADPNDPDSKIVQFKLIRKLFGEDGPGQYTELIPWTMVGLSIEPDIPLNRNTTVHKIGIEYKNGEITVFVNDSRVSSIHDDRLPSGLSGMALFGTGDAIFHDLMVQDLH